MLPEIREVQQALEDKFNMQIAGVDAKAQSLPDADARAYLTNYSCAQADNTMVEWQRLAIFLLTKYLDGQERKIENGEFVRNPYGEPASPNRLPLPENCLRTFTDEVIHE